MRRKIREIFSLWIVLLFLPYAVTLFMNGQHIRTSGRIRADFVKVQVGDRIQEMEWETYLAGVLAKEMPPDFEPEALKAQAVILRSNLYAKLETGGTVIFTEAFCPVSELERQWGRERAKAFADKLAEAVRSTENQVLQYQGNYVRLPYHRLSGGQTRSGQEAFASGEYPYLPTRDCAKDIEADGQISRVTADSGEAWEKCRGFLVAVEQPGKKKIKGEDFEVTETDSAGYVTSVRIGETACTGEEFRDALGLKSSKFILQGKKDKLKITVNGIGHGVGMSQNTANEMAKEGKSFAEILQYFYEGTELVDGGEIFRWTPE